MVILVDPAHVGAVEPGQGGNQILLQGLEGARGGGLTADQDVIEAGAGNCRQRQPRGLAQAALDAVAHHGIADLLGHGETDARRQLIIAFAGLQDRARRAP